MRVIPTQAVPSQVMSVQLGPQIAQIKLYQKSTGMYIDLYVSGQLIIAGVLCENLNRIVRDAYLGFVGDIAFIDNQGKEDPAYYGLGTRWNMLYLEVGDLP